LPLVAQVLQQKKKKYDNPTKASNGKTKIATAISTSVAIKIYKVATP
jgi:hypothetical protein